MVGVCVDGVALRIVSQRRFNLYSKRKDVWCSFLTYLEEFALVVPRVNRIFIGTWAGEELAAVDAEGCKGKGSVGGFFEGAMLELHYPLWASWSCCCKKIRIEIFENSDVRLAIGYCAVICFLVMAIIRKRI